MEIYDYAHYTVLLSLLLKWNLWVRSLHCFTSLLLTLEIALPSLSPGILVFPYNLYVRQQFQCEEVQWSLTCFTTQFLEQMVQRYWKFEMGKRFRYFNFWCRRFNKKNHKYFKERLTYTLYCMVIHQYLTHLVWLFYLLLVWKNYIKMHPNKSLNGTKSRISRTVETYFIIICWN